jgi:hypothetical protein
MNITHIINLYRAYFIENKKTLLIFCAITFGALTYSYTVPSIPELSLAIPYFIMFWLAGSFFQSHFKKNNSVHFFNLPATSGEKLMNSILVLLTVGIAIEILQLAGAFTGFYLFRPLLNFGDMRYVYNGMDIWNELAWGWKQYFVYIAGLSVFLFGSIYFKKYAFVKTLGSGFGILLGIGFYSLLLSLLFVMPSMGDMNNLENSNLSINLAQHAFFQNHYYMLAIAATLFFLSLTYLRLKETEV